MKQNRGLEMSEDSANVETVKQLNKEEKLRNRSKYQDLSSLIGASAVTSINERPRYRFYTEEDYVFGKKEPVKIYLVDMPIQEGIDGSGGFFSYRKAILTFNKIAIYHKNADFINAFLEFAKEEESKSKNAYIDKFFEKVKKVDWLNDTHVQKTIKELLFKMLLITEDQIKSIRFSEFKKRIDVFLDEKNSKSKAFVYDIYNALSEVYPNIAINYKRR